MRRTNLMDILNEEKKSEPLQLVKKGYGIVGGILLVVGLLLGYAGSQLTANLLKFQMPAIWNAVYLVAAVGIYMLFVFFIVYHKRGKHPQKYYHNLDFQQYDEISGKTDRPEYVYPCFSDRCSTLRRLLYPRQA